MSFTDKIVASIPKLARGFVWCLHCGRAGQVDSARALERGWPKCCGYMMTIDSPEERAALRATSSVGPAPRSSA